MKKTTNLIPAQEINNLPDTRPKSLRPTPSLSGSKSLKPKLAVRPLKVIKGPQVG